MLGRRRQLNREEADYGRFVTKVRWVIESVNGRMKNVFAFFRHQIQNTYITKLKTFIRIASALLNKYFRAIYPDNPEQVAIANYMIERSRAAATFHEDLQHFELNVFSRAQYHRTEIENIQDFPLLTEQELREITAGIY